MITYRLILACSKCTHSNTVYKEITLPKTFHVSCSNCYNTMNFKMEEESSSLLVVKNDRTLKVEIEEWDL